MSTWSLTSRRSRHDIATGVAHDVGERLGGDPVRGHLDGSGQDRLAGGQVELDLEDAVEAADELRQRAGEALVVERGRP